MIRNRKLAEDEFFAQRKEVLAQWQTGQEIGDSSPKYLTLSSGRSMDFARLCPICRLLSIAHWLSGVRAAPTSQQWSI